MINFILCDDNMYHIKSIKEIIHKSLINNDTDYKVHVFSDVNHDLNEMIGSTLKNKIYILDIELPSGSGLDVAKKIRDSSDWNSIIIMNTVHYELSHATYKRRLMIFDFISKFNQAESHLFNTIVDATKIIGSKQYITFVSERITYRLSIDELIYLEWENDARKTIIHTAHNDYFVTISLKDATAMLSDHFLKVNRFTIINKKYITQINLDNDYVILNNNIKINCIAINKKKELKNYVNN